MARAVQRSGRNGGRIVRAARAVLPVLANAAGRYIKRRMSSDTHVSEKGEAVQAQDIPDEPIPVFRLISTSKRILFI